VGKRREYSFEIVDRCEGLYVQGEETLEAIAKQTSVSIAQVQRWAAKYEWKEKKEKFRERVMKAQEETRALVREEILLQDLVNQKNLLDRYFQDREYDKADSNTLSNYINVVNNIAKLLQDIRKRDETLRTAQKIDRPQIFLDFMRDLVSFLKDHDPAALAALEKNFDDFIAFAKEKYAN
jgi:hypothetical protein